MVGRAVVWAFGVRTLLLCHTVSGSSTRGAKTKTSQALQVNAGRDDRDGDNDHVNDGDENHGHDVQTSLLRQLHGRALRHRLPAGAADGDKKESGEEAGGALFLEHQEQTHREKEPQEGSLLNPYKCDKWASLIETRGTDGRRGSCPVSASLTDSGLPLPLRCISPTEKDGYTIWMFGAGTFGIDRQVLVPPYTILLGNADPNIETLDGSPRDDAQKLNFVNDRNYDRADGVLRRSFVAPDFAPEIRDADAFGSAGTQTLILATKQVTQGAYCKASGDAIKTARIGFVMSSNTAARNLNYQGVDRFRPSDSGQGICGGAVFETTGCSTTWCCEEGADSTQNKNVQCKKGAGSTQNNNQDDPVEHNRGKPAENVLITNIRINDVYSTEDATRTIGYKAKSHDFRDQTTLMGPNGDQPWNVRSSQLVFWIPDTRGASDEFTKNIILRNIIAYSTHADGLSIRSKAENVLIDNVHIQNSGSDGFVLWGAGTSRNVAFRNCEMVNPGGMQSGRYSFGNCATIFGAGHGKVVFDNFRCVTPFYSQVKEFPTPWGLWWHYLVAVSTMLRITGPTDTWGTNYYGTEIFLTNYELLQLNGTEHPKPTPDSLALDRTCAFGRGRAQTGTMPPSAPGGLLWMKSDPLHGHEGEEQHIKLDEKLAPFCLDNFPDDISTSWYGPDAYELKKRLNDKEGSNVRVHVADNFHQLVQNRVGVEFIQEIESQGSSLQLMQERIANVERNV